MRRGGGRPEQYAIKLGKTGQTVLWANWSTAVPYPKSKPSDRLVQKKPPTQLHNDCTGAKRPLLPPKTQAACSRPLLHTGPARTHTQSRQWNPLPLFPLVYTLPLHSDSKSNTIHVNPNHCPSIAALHTHRGPPQRGNTAHLLPPSHSSPTFSMMTFSPFVVTTLPSRYRSLLVCCCTFLGTVSRSAAVPPFLLEGPLPSDTARRSNLRTHSKRQHSATHLVDSLPATRATS